MNPSQRGAKQRRKPFESENNKWNSEAEEAVRRERRLEWSREQIAEIYQVQRAMTDTE